MRLLKRNILDAVDASWMDTQWFIDPNTFYSFQKLRQAPTGLVSSWAIVLLAGRIAAICKFESNIIEIEIAENWDCWTCDFDS